jgi:hypothetical protein
MLEAMKGPKTLNTVEKTSADWETFKKAEGISDDVEQARKKG